MYQLKAETRSCLWGLYIKYIALDGYFFVIYTFGNGMSHINKGVLVQQRKKYVAINIIAMLARFNN
jgi:hypothetical protein